MTYGGGANVGVADLLAQWLGGQRQQGEALDDIQATLREANSSAALELPTQYVNMGNYPFLHSRPEGGGQFPGQTPQNA